MQQRLSTNSTYSSELIEWWNRIDLSETSLDLNCSRIQNSIFFELWHHLCFAVLWSCLIYHRCISYTVHDWSIHAYYPSYSFPSYLLTVNFTTRSIFFASVTNSFCLASVNPFMWLKFNSFNFMSEGNWIIWSMVSCSVTRIYSAVGEDSLRKLRLSVWIDGFSGSKASKIENSFSNPVIVALKKSIGSQWKDKKVHLQLLSFQYRSPTPLIELPIEERS